MRPILVILLVTALAFAGCAGGDDGTTTSRSPTGTGTSQTTSQGTSSSGTTAGTTTTTGTTSGIGTNKAPTGTLAVDVPAGAVPLNVTFGMTGTDADSDPLSWTLDVDGDGEPESSQDAPATFPATYTHTFATAGVYNVTYTLTDGETPVTYQAVVNASSGNAAITFTGTVTSPDPLAAAGEGCNLNAIVILGGPDNFGDNFDLPPNAPGGSYTIEPAGMRAEFWSADFADYLDGGESGTVPADAAIATTCGTSPDNVDVEYTLSIVPV